MTMYGMKQFLFAKNNIITFFVWLPRILSIVFILFLSLFALDVFSEYKGLAVAAPLLIHLLPSLTLFCIVIIAWKHELVGAIAFIGFAVFYVWGVGLARPPDLYLSIVFPLVLIGICYLVRWRQKSTGFGRK